jgi:Arc-like DNA binding domain
MMTPPKKVKWVQLNVRVANELRDKLTKDAQRNGVSINIEAAKRLGRSYVEAEALGGEEARDLLHLMTKAFLLAGSRAAGGRKPSSWLTENEDAYAAGVAAVLEVLLMGQPNAVLEKILNQIESLKGRVATKFVNAPERAAS